MRRFAGWQHEETRDAGARAGGLDQAFAGEVTFSVRAWEATADIAAMVKAEGVGLAETSAAGDKIFERKLDRAL
jgi:hypothetical protein